jgi:hypothetical protein
MGTSTFGIGNNISNIASQTPTYSGTGAPSNSNKSNILIGRVRDIILDSSHPKFEEEGSWSSLGTIFYSNISTEEESINKAQPLFSNSKFYPLINEIVYLVVLPSPQSQAINYTDAVADLNSTYYFPPVNAWGGIEHNAIPLNPRLNNSSKAKEYRLSGGGLSKEVNSQPNAIPLNSPSSPATFIEKGNIQSLLPYAGDHIIEGRFGNSIRFGSTVTGSNIANSWSFGDSNEGDAITILRNGAGKNNQKSWEYITENINNDSSSIYLTTTQQIPLSASSEDYTSYTTEAPQSINTYSSSSQVIINSGRLVFNTTQDHLMLSSKKSINLNSIEGINIDTRGNFVVQSSQVYLGDSENSLTQPVVLGDDLVSLLTDILSDLSLLTNTLKFQIGVPSGSPLAPTSTIADGINQKIPQYQTRLNNSLSKITRTA